MTRRVGARILLIVLGVLVLQACGLRPGPAPADLHAHPFLVCTRAHESDRDDVNGNGLHDAGYHTATGNGYWGAYQFLQSTWDNTARHAGWNGLVGVRPSSASVAEQDQMAWHLYEWQGSSPWGGRCG